MSWWRWFFRYFIWSLVARPRPHEEQRHRDSDSLANPPPTSPRGLIKTSTTMPSVFSRLGSAASKLGRKLRPRVRHGPGHYRRKHLPNLALITGGVGLGFGADALVSQISPEEEVPIYAQGEFAPVHQNTDDSFNIFRFSSEAEEFEDNSIHETLSGNSTTESDSEWNITHLVAMHKGSATTRRIKGICLAIILLLVMYIIFKIYRKIKRGRRNSEMDPPRSARLWRKLPGLPRILQVFPPSPPSAETSRGSVSTKVSAPPTHFDAAKYTGVTPQDLDRWSSLATNSHYNVQRIIQNVEGGPNSIASHSLPTNSDVPSMESIMFNLQRDLPPGAAAGRPSFAPPCPPTVERARGQVPQADSAPTVPSPATSPRPAPPPQNGGHTADAPASKAGESLARLRQIIEYP